MLWVDDETPYERPFVRISTSSPPVIPLFLTIPNGFASLETVYIATKPDTNSSKLQYNPLYTFEVLSQKLQFKAVAICRTNIYIAWNSYALIPVRIFLCLLILFVNSHVPVPVNLSFSFLELQRNLCLRASTHSETLIKSKTNPNPH